MWSIPLDGGIRGFREVKIGCWGEPALVPTSKSHTEKKEEKNEIKILTFHKASFWPKTIYFLFAGGLVSPPGGFASLLFDQGVP